MPEYNVQVYGHDVISVTADNESEAKDKVGKITYQEDYKFASIELGDVDEVIQ